ncbi:MAG: sensor histidine kinase [Bacillota bacterium]
MHETTDFPSSNGRQAILRSVAEVLDQIERCAELVGDNQQVQALLDDAGDKLRRTIRDLRLQMSPLGDLPLDGRDLHGSLSRLVEHVRQALGIPMEAFLDPQIGMVLPAVESGHVLHLVREAVANAVQHAGATRMALRAEVENHRLVIRLSDDGRGFDVKAPRSPVQAGLSVMRQRAEAARGLLQVESAPGAGTIVTLTVPLRTRRLSGHG